MNFLNGKKKSHLPAAALLTSLLLFAGWPASGFAPLLLIAWIPLLVLEDYFYENRRTVRHKKVFFYGYLSFLVWNILSTWWIWYASAAGAVLAIFFNSLFMATIFSLFHKTRCRIGSRTGYLELVVFWVGFEYLHLNWDLSWPWLTLGNGFSAFPKIVQWYEYTGVLGGSAWILLCNILIFRSLKQIFSGNTNMANPYRLVSYTLIVILLPVVFSEWVYYSYTEKQYPVNVAVVQPNIDPYHEKFTGLSSEEQVSKLLQLSSTVVDSNTDYLVGPETSLPYSIWEDKLPYHHNVKTLKNFLSVYPDLKMVTGVSTNRLYGDKPGSNTARQFSDSPESYDSFNTAMQLDKDGNIQLYHKSQLVIGVEKIPYPKVFGYFEKFAITLGGASGSLGTQEEPSVFDSPEKIKVAPAICYESIYGEYITKYIEKGAHLIFIITNDGWWYDTPGYRQHLQYARLRAIETRRSIARSANTGISAFINQRGDIIEKTVWWKPAAIRQTLNAGQEITFYVKYGDFIGVIASGMGIILLLSMALFPFFRKSD